MFKFVKREFKTLQYLPDVERLPALQVRLNHYMDSIWGRGQAILRAKAKINRKFRLKHRADTKLNRKNLFWQRAEDLKELKVIHDKAREAREARGEQFSFKKYANEYRESKKKPFVILDEPSFEKFLEEQKEKKFFKGIFNFIFYHFDLQFRPCFT